MLSDNGQNLFYHERIRKIISGQESKGVVHHANQQSRPADLSNRIAALIHNLTNSQTTVEKPFLRLWALPSLRRQFYTVIISETIDRVGPMVAVAETPKFSSKGGRRFSVRASKDLFEFSHDAVKAYLLEYATCIVTHENVSDFFFSLTL